MLITYTDLYNTYLQETMTKLFSKYAIALLGCLQLGSASSTPELQLVEATNSKASAMSIPSTVISSSPCWGLVTAASTGVVACDAPPSRQEIGSASPSRRLRGSALAAN
jgi:hypothetical protein